jgi:hypothetical protein
LALVLTKSGGNMSAIEALNRTKYCSIRTQNNQLSTI